MFERGTAAQCHRRAAFVLAAGTQHGHRFRP